MNLRNQIFTFLFVSPWFLYSTPSFAIAPKTIKFDLGPVQVAANTPNMEGPTSKPQTIFSNLKETPWITSMKVETFSKGKILKENPNVCHAGIMKTAKVGKIKGDTSVLYSYQAQTQQSFPKGFAYRIRNFKDYDFSVSGMYANFLEKDVNLTARISVSYLLESDAKRSKIKPLTRRTAAILRRDNKHAHFHDGHSLGRHVNHFSWKVKPGNFTFKSDITRLLNLKKSIQVHYLKPHLHPYAEFIQLINKTENKVLWTGKSKTKNGAIVFMENYSSASGFKMNKDHKFELITRYNNTSNKDIDAMATVAIFSDK